jgi:hypothetical protein
VLVRVADGVGNMIQVSKSTSFGVNDLFFTTSVTLENTGDNTLFAVQYMRNVDPDQEQVRCTCQTLKFYIAGVFSLALEGCFAFIAFPREIHTEVSTFHTTDDTSKLGRVYACLDSLSVVA